MAATTLRLSDDLHERVTAFAKHFGLTFNAAVTLMIERQLAEIERPFGMKIAAMQQAHWTISGAREHITQAVNLWMDQMENVFARIEQEAHEAYEASQKETDQ